MASKLNWTFLEKMGAAIRPPFQIPSNTLDNIHLGQYDYNNNSIPQRIDSSTKQDKDLMHKDFSNQSKRVNSQNGLGLT